LGFFVTYTKEKEQLFFKEKKNGCRASLRDRPFTAHAPGPILSDRERPVEMQGWPENGSGRMLFLKLDATAMAAQAPVKCAGSARVPTVQPSAAAAAEP